MASVARTRASQFKVLAIDRLTGRRALLGHPRVGASWEGFAIEQVLAAVRPSEAYYWGTHGGAELDLFFVVNGADAAWR